MRIICLFAFAFICFSSLNAQAGNPAQAESASLQAQYDEMLRVSNRYQRFKVVRQDFLDAFIGNVSDSIANYTRQIGQLNNTISEQQDRLAAQTQTIEEKETAIAGLNEEKDSVSLLGMSLSKATYNIILWSVIIGLAAALLLALARMRLAVSAHREIRSHGEKLSSELERSKKERLKIEQELRRKLQDEINKNRG